jgi:K+-sensing histidine kinase KdpD
LSQERLTRHELSWLLAQEARGAARALREGVSQLKVPTAEPRITTVEPVVETNLDALEDAIDMLSALNVGNRGKSRRGRIDIAALLYEVAPNARIGIEPGAGTEVFGDEFEIRRMLNLLVHQADAAPTNGSAAEVTIRRQGDAVRVSVELGPDTAVAAELERRWLSRMATRYGGWVELEGGTQVLYLPADGASDQREVVELRKELEQAQQQGEAYARELAAVLSAGDVRSELPPPITQDRDTQRFELLQNTAASLHRVLKGWVEGLRSDATLASEQDEKSELAQSLARRVTVGQELLADLSQLHEVRSDEPRQEVDLVASAREVVQNFDGRASRLGLELTLRAPETACIESRPTRVRLLLRTLLQQALAASARDTEVVMSVTPTELGVLIVVEDSGPNVPEASRADVIKHRVDPTSFGRPTGMSLLVADVVCGALGAELGMREGAAGRTELWTLLSRKTD